MSHRSDKRRLDFALASIREENSRSLKSIEAGRRRSSMDNSFNSSTNGEFDYLQSVINPDNPRLSKDDSFVNRGRMHRYSTGSLRDLSSINEVEAEKNSPGGTATNQPQTDTTSGDKEMPNRIVGAYDWHSTISSLTLSGRTLEDTKKIAPPPPPPPPLPPLKKMFSPLMGKYKNRQTSNGSQNSDTGARKSAAINTFSPLSYTSRQSSVGSQKSDNSERGKTKKTSNKRFWRYSSQQSAVGSQKSETDERKSAAVKSFFPLTSSYNSRQSSVGSVTSKRDTSNKSARDTSNRSALDLSDPTSRDNSNRSALDLSDPTSRNQSNRSALDSSDPTSRDQSNRSALDSSDPTSRDNSNRSALDLSDPTSRDLSDKSSNGGDISPLTSPMLASTSRKAPKDPSSRSPSRSSSYAPNRIAYAGRQSTLSTLTTKSGERYNNNNNRSSLLGFPINESKKMEGPMNLRMSGHSNRQSAVSYRNDLSNGERAARPSALRRGGPNNRKMAVNFAEEPTDRDSIYIDFEDKNDYSADDLTEYERSEQFFHDPRQSQRQQVKFENYRTQGSLAEELQDIEEYLASLKKSIVIASTTDTDSDRTPVVATRRRNPDAGSEIDDKAGFYGAGHDPKSKRRFSMAFRTSDEVVTYPDDCFSFLILHGPIGSKDSVLFFWFALFVSALQFVFLLLALTSEVMPTWTLDGGTDNPVSKWNFLPSNVGTQLRMTQVLAVISYCLFAESSLKDLITAVEIFPQYSKVTKDDNYWCMVFSCVLRGSLGLLTAITTLLMLMTSDSVIDTILDFLAMNFISDIGKMAFQLALWGKYGPKLENEARMLEEEPMPDCMLRPHSWKRYLITLFSVVIALLLSMALIIRSQVDTQIWTTKSIRVQFVDNTKLEPYSGCYKVKEYPNRRGLFEGDKPNRDRSNPARIGYCITTRKWRLYKTDERDACAVVQENVLAESPPTGDFDISAVTGDAWSDKYGAIIEMYIDKSTEIDGLEEKCGSFLNDGECDTIYNNYMNNYDFGDCCASTCTHSNCGVDALKEAFGTTLEQKGDGFPDCIDPNMWAITVSLDGIFDSSTYGDSLQSLTDLESYRIYQEQNPEWRDLVIKPTLLLDCDGRNQLTVQVNDTMSGHNETVKVDDGANCTIRITNTTANQPRLSIWYVNYTIYHGDSTNDEEPIVILREQSAAKNVANFKRYPNCYLNKLSKYIDKKIMYTGNSPQNQAIEWLQQSSQTSRSSSCEDSYFVERYALSVLNFAAPIQPKSFQDDTNVESIRNISAASDGLVSDTAVPATPLLLASTPANGKLWIEETRQCIWRFVECRGNSVNKLRLFGLNISGTIASSIGLLSNLEMMSIADNYYSGTIPGEIGNLTSLKFLDLENNTLAGTIPKELGDLTTLERIKLYDNSLSGTILSEIGKLTALKLLHLGENSLSGTIPIEIGKLNSLEYSFDLSNNSLTGTIPSEIGNLNALGKLTLNDNSLSGTIPSEIGRMTTLVTLDLSNNFLTGSIPPEVGRLGLDHNLKKIYLGSMPLTFMDELRDIVYAECVVSGCTPLANGNQAEICKELREVFDEYKQMTFDDCETLRRDCFIC